MPTVVAHHTITKGAEHWLKSPRRAEFFGAIGVTNIRTFVNPQDPTHVAVVMDVPDMEAMAAAMQSEAAADAMSNDGVVPDSRGDPGRVLTAIASPAGARRRSCTTAKGRGKTSLPAPFRIPCAPARVPLCRMPGKPDGLAASRPTFAQTAAAPDHTTGTRVN